MLEIAIMIIKRIVKESTDLELFALRSGYAKWVDTITLTSKSSVSINCLSICAHSH
jgi:hypothetical protein